MCCDKISKKRKKNDMNMRFVSCPVILLMCFYGNKQQCLHVIQFFSCMTDIKHQS